MAETKEGGPQAVDMLMAEYKEKLASSQLSKKDKDETLRLIQSDPKIRNAETLQQHLSYLPKAERFSKELDGKYEKRLDGAIREGLFSKDPQTKKEYMEWFKELSSEEKMKTIEAPLYKEKERKEASEAFKRLPSAERKKQQATYDKLGIEERQALLKKLSAQHEGLKATFLKLPKEVQKKHREKFIALTLDQRAAFLKTLGAVSPAENKKQSEGLERQKNIKALDEKMTGLVKENLFSPLSVPAYQAWFKGLTLEQQRGSLGHSDLDNPERRVVRDKFLALTPEQRKAHELRFRNADLDKRKEIVASVKTPAGGTHQKNSYPPEIMEKTIQTALHDPHVQHQRLLLTMLDESIALKKKGEIRYDAKKADVTVKKARERGNEVDERQVLHMETLTHKAESRFSLKKFLRFKEEKGIENAVANNMVLTNANHEEISVEEFEKHAVDHQRDEAIASIMNLAAARLPGMDREQMRKNLEKRDLHVNLRDAIAA